jgi:hypothetical protein
MMADSNDEEWNFYFGRGGQSNKRRKVSKANNLLQKLALRYSKCRQSDKRVFALKEVYEVVIKNGGKFYQIIDKKPVDVTKDEVESIKKIMQGLRDVNKHCKTAPLPPRSTRSPSSPRKGKESSPRKKKETPPIGLKIRKVPSLKRTSSITPVRRPKRTCVKPSIVEAPIIECVRDALNVAKTSGGIVGVVTGAVKVDEKNASSGCGGARQESCGSENNDILDMMAVEPPKLENSFSALIMADEITADLPTDSQKNINQSLHARVQRLENLVAMLMQQKNEELERLL